MRGLLAPMLAIILIACAAIGGYAAARFAILGEPTTTLVWICIAAAGLGCIAAVWFARTYSRRQSQAIVAALRKAIPPGESPDVLGAASARSGIDAVVDAMAGSFTQLLAQAAKDKGQLLTVIASMNEGLVAVDHLQRILLAN